MSLSKKKKNFISLIVILTLMIPVLPVSTEMVDVKLNEGDIVIYQMTSVSSSGNIEGYIKYDILSIKNSSNLDTTIINYNLTMSLNLDPWENTEESAQNINSTVLTNASLIADSLNLDTPLFDIISVSPGLKIGNYAQEVADELNFRYNQVNFNVQSINSSKGIQLNYTIQGDNCSDEYYFGDDGILISFTRISDTDNDGVVDSHFIIKIFSINGNPYGFETDTTTSDTTDTTTSGSTDENPSIVGYSNILMISMSLITLYSSIYLIKKRNNGRY